MVAIPRILKMGICNSPHFIHLETETEENSICPLEQGLISLCTQSPFIPQRLQGPSARDPGTKCLSHCSSHSSSQKLLWRGGSTQCCLWDFCSLSWHRNWVLSSEGLSPDVLTTEPPGDSPLRKLWGKNSFLPSIAGKVRLIKKGSSIPKCSQLVNHRVKISTCLHS